MKTQQQAEREEQQRIKNLVLNYDLRENEELDGEAHSAPLQPNTNIHSNSLGNDKATHHHNRAENRAIKERGGQRVRKLQFSDSDWYDNSQNKSPSSPAQVRVLGHGWGRIPQAPSRTISRKEMPRSLPTRGTGRA